MKNSTQTLLFTLALLVVSIPYVFAQNRQQDSLALVALYNTTDGPNWSVNTNWLQTGTTINQWYGVTVSGNRVVKLNLNNINLVGTLPAALGQLPLTHLYVQDNHLSGGIPAFPNADFNNADFRTNNFSSIDGDIGCSGGSKLYFSRNQISDISSFNIVGNNNVSWLALDNNQLLPSALSAPAFSLGSNIKILKLNNNSTLNTLYPQQGFFTDNSLDRLDISHCNFYGPLPRSSANCQYEYFIASNNQFEETLDYDDTIFHSNSTAYGIHFANNKLSGAIPINLFTSTSAELNVSNNSFSQPIIRDTIKPLFIFNVRNNNFTYQSFDAIYKAPLSLFYFFPQARISAHSDTISLGDTLCPQYTEHSLDNYQWYWYDFSINWWTYITTGECYTPTSPGKYIQLVTNPIWGNYMLTDSIIVIDTSSAKKAPRTSNTGANDQVISLYPNPSGGEIHLESTSPNDLLNISVSNLQGALILQASGTTYQVENSLQDWTVNATGGLYFIKLTNDNINEIITLSLVK